MYQHVSAQLVKFSHHLVTLMLMERRVNYAAKLQKCFVDHNLAPPPSSSLYISMTEFSFSGELYFLF